MYKRCILNGRISKWHGCKCFKIRRVENVETEIKFDGMLYIRSIHYSQLINQRNLFSRDLINYFSVVTLK